MPRPQRTTVKAFDFSKFYSSRLMNFFEIIQHEVHYYFGHSSVKLIIIDLLVFTVNLRSLSLPFSNTKFVKNNELH